MSRVSRPQDITIYLDDEKKTHGYRYQTPYTTNVVYRTVLEDEIGKYKKSDDYQGPDLFDESKMTLRLFKIILFLRNCI